MHRSYVFSDAAWRVEKQVDSRDMQFVSPMKPQAPPILTTVMPE